MRAIVRTVIFPLLLLSLSIYCSAQTQGILTKNVNLRSGPSADAPRIATLKVQSKVRILNPTPNNGFYHVRTVQKKEGWIWAQGVKVSQTSQPSRKLVRPSATRELEPGAGAMAAAAACQTDLASCPASGCAAPDSSHGLANQLKRTLPTGTNAVMLTFDDFNSLQQQADSLVGQNKELSPDDRAKLKGLTAGNGQVSEGDLVSLAGFLVGVPHPNTGESVNCNLKGESNNDFHIPLSNDPSNSDFQGIVVEMIPQSRPDAWNVSNLTQVENNQQLVMVTGALFYDNFHRVNGDPNNPERGQPHRFSLFEIHPITQFVVCTKSDNSCDPSQSSDWAPIGGVQ